MYEKTCLINFTNFLFSQQFGEIINQMVDDATPSIVINFKSRKEAEVALIKGRTFQDRLLSVTWVTGHHLHRGGGGGNASSNVPQPARSEQAPPTADEEIELEVGALANLIILPSDRKLRLNFQ